MTYTQSELDLNKLSLCEFKKQAKSFKSETIKYLLNSPGKLEHHYYSLGILKQRLIEIKEMYLKKLEPMVRKKYKQLLEKLYRRQVAGKDYDIMQDYVRDWNELRADFFSQI